MLLFDFTQPVQKSHAHTLLLYLSLNFAWEIFISSSDAMSFFLPHRFADSEFAKVVPSKK